MEGCVALLVPLVEDLELRTPRNVDLHHAVVFRRLGVECNSVGLGRLLFELGAKAGDDLLGGFTSVVEHCKY